MKALSTSRHSTRPSKQGLVALAEFSRAIAYAFLPAAVERALLD